MSGENRCQFNVPSPKDGEAEEDKRPGTIKVPSRAPMARLCATYPATAQESHILPKVSGT